jgi:outer membrane biosynthesis protein TonB
MSETQAINKKAAGITLAVHLALLLLCMLIGYSLPANNQSIEELGMEVNLGNSEDGSGDNQAFSTEHPAYQPEETNRSAQKESSDPPANLATDESDADAPTIKPTVDNKRKQAAQNENIQKAATAQAKPKVLFPAANGNGGNAASINQSGGSEGNGKGNGDKGVPGGTPGSDNYTGSPGNGTSGIGWSFSDRQMVARPDPAAEFREGGKVVIRVTVNREGQIVAKSVKSAPSNELRRIALDKLNDVRFNKSTTAPPEQFGDITFVFKTRAQK